MSATSSPKCSAAAREAIEAYAALKSDLDDIAEPDGSAELDEDAFWEALLSGELDTAFGAVTGALRSGVHVNRIAEAMVMLAADRMARTPVSFNPGWWDLGAEMQTGSVVRGDHRHAATRRPQRPSTTPRGSSMATDG